MHKNHPPSFHKNSFSSVSFIFCKTFSYASCLWNQFLRLIHQNCGKYCRSLLLNSHRMGGCYRAQMFWIFLTWFSVIFFQFVFSSLSVLIMWRIFLQPKWLSDCNMPGGLWLHISVFSDLLSPEFLASLIKMNRLFSLHTPWNCTCGFSFLVFYHRTRRYSPRNFNRILRDRITMCYLKGKKKKKKGNRENREGKSEGKEREYYGMSFCFLPACKQIFLLLFFLLFFTASWQPERMLTYSSSETRDEAAAGRTASGFHKWQLSLNILKETK